MDKFNFVRNGIIRLPPGFRFQPTEEELVFQYLRCKVFSCPLPASIIPEINLSAYDPWDLPGDTEQERYFFSNKESKYPNGNRTSRVTCSGYWKATGSDKKIVSAKRNSIVGRKKSLVFYRGKAPNGSKTNWIMHEYSLVNNLATRASSTQVCFTLIFLRAHIFTDIMHQETISDHFSAEQDKPARKLGSMSNSFKENKFSQGFGYVANDDGIKVNNVEKGHLQINRTSPVSPCSSCSSCSGITEVSSSHEVADGDEEISRCSTF